MGELSVKHADKENRASFIKHLLNDIETLEIMLNQGMIEDDITRIGSEQEFCLVNECWRPAKNAIEILELIDDPHFTTELARYNLEINLDPVELKSDCFSIVEKRLNGYLQKASRAAKKLDTKVVLTGILPTISKNELAFDYMTPNPRYWALNDMIKELRGSDFELHLRGVDELSIFHDSVLFEACNTSFQMHLQIAPKDFVSSYNWAQAISGPILSACTNSPLLLGRELWRETRIALFQQSIDTRHRSYALKDQKARVTFGDEWAAGSAADIFKNDIARYKVILAKEIGVDSKKELKKGNIPKLNALTLHNGTVYRWNRPCYGVGGGKAHLRIENRYIPSGPTTVDEIANFAFWVGIMMGRPKEFDDMSSVMDFRDAKSNFINAARSGKENVMRWKGEEYSAKDLVLNELLPIAYEGLIKSKIDPDDINRLLGIIERRTQGMTGAQWKLKNYRKLRQTMKQDDALLALTKVIHELQRTDLPIDAWPEIEATPETAPNANQIGHIMSTQLFTVNDNDLAELATSVMEWKGIHHIPVENKSGELCGILTWTHMKNFKAKNGRSRNAVVADIMADDVITAKPNLEIDEAIKIMKKNEIGCLPVVHDKHLVGIVTITDVIAFDRAPSI